MNIGKFFTTLGHDVKVAAKAVSAQLPRVEMAAEVAAPFFGPGAVAFEQLAERLAGDALATVHTADPAVRAKGLNLTLDAALIADIEALLPQLITAGHALAKIMPPQVTQPAPVAAPVAPAFAPPPSEPPAA